MKIELNRDWSEFLCALIGRRVRFVLIGGHAVAGHGEPRFTEDLDVFVEPTLANARRLRAALADFGFGESLPPAKASPLFVIGREALLVNKRASGRRKDLLDIAILEAHSARTTTRSVRKPVKKRGPKPSTRH